MKRGKIVLGVIVALVVIATSVAAAGALSPDVCPQGGDWSSHQSPPAHAVDGAVEYCGKAGTSVFYSNSPLSCEQTDEGEWLCNGQENGLSHWSYRLGETTPEPTDTPTNEPTATPTNVPTGEPTPTNGPTDVPTQEPTPTTPPRHPPEEVCDGPPRVIGHLFELVGPDGQTAQFASFSPRPDGDGYYLPNTQSQQACLGWVAVNAPSGVNITVDCNGNLNVTLIKCHGGGCSAVYNGE